MNITITPEYVLLAVILLLMGLQIRQHIYLEKAKKDINRLWEQISIFNTMVAMKILESQKELDKLNKKDNTNGVTEKI